MQQDEGFEKYNEQGNQLGCKFSKNLYELKQSGRNRYLTIKNFLGLFVFCSIYSRIVLLYKKGQKRFRGKDLSLSIRYAYIRNATKLLRQLKNTKLMRSSN